MGCPVLSKHFDAERDGEINPQNSIFFKISFSHGTPLRIYQSRSYNLASRVLGDGLWQARIQEFSSGVQLSKFLTKKKEEDRRREVVMVLSFSRSIHVLNFLDNYLHKISKVGMTSTCKYKLSRAFNRHTSLFSVWHGFLYNWKRFSTETYRWHGSFIL